MIVWGYVIDFSVFQLQKSLKIVSNVVFVKLKVNFSQAKKRLTNWLMFLYGQTQSPRPSQCPPFGRALRRALGFVSARIETSAS